ncbi:MAG: hypothetical protein ACYC9X_10380, partial [Dehalococcoidia bacterium]
PWRLLDIVAATLSFRGAFLGGGSLLPRVGAADPPDARGEPVAELPGSYVSDVEQQQAVAEERARRFVRARRPRERA